MMNQNKLTIHLLLTVIATVGVSFFSVSCTTVSFTGAHQKQIHSNTKEAKRVVSLAKFEPVIGNIEGWTVYMDPKLLPGGKHAREGGKALGMLRNHLQRIAILVKGRRLRNMRKVGIWIEHAHPELNNMQYHPDVKWLVDHGYDARLAKKVHITNAARLFDREQMLKQPAIILHELAHGYHDQILGFEYAPILQAYKKAMKAGVYDKVLRYDGQEKSAYAATDYKEYFAEGVEAYFYRNDFYPFVRAELKKHDATLHDLMEKIWGPVK